MMNLETLLKILRRLPRDRFTVEAIRTAEEGAVPSADLLHRCGIRTGNSEVVA